MPRLIFLFSILPLIIAFAARWWFGIRVLAQEGEQRCQCDLANWYPAPDDHAVIHRADGTAGEFGSQLRKKALAEWAEEMPKAAASREGSLRFGKVVPPLSAIVAILALFVGKIPVMGVIAILVGATALSAFIGMITLPPELQAITRAASKIRASKSFPNSDQEAAIFRCAIAHAWKQAFPPIFGLVQK